MKKDEEFQIRIEDLTEDGSGVGHVEGMAVFVKDAVPGDEALVKILRMKKNYAYGRLIRLIRASPWRTEPLCPEARPCGGCTIMQMSYAKQLEYKRNIVENCLRRIGGVGNAADLGEGILGMDSPWHYRNKMQFPVGTDSSGNLITGFYAAHSHRIVPTEDCPIGHPVNRRILKTVKKYLNQQKIPAYDERTGKGILRHILTRVGFATGELMVCLVINAGNLPTADHLTEPLKKDAEAEGLKLVSLSLNVNQDRTNRILGSRIINLYGPGYLEDEIGGLRFRISPLSFYQVNPVQTEKLYQTACDYADLTGTEKVWDLYCGTGTISLFLAKHAGQVTGVEIVPDAVRDARKNAERNQIHNVEFFTGKAEEKAAELYQQNRRKYQADVVVVDPPRKGCDEKLLSTIVEMNPRRIVYVSCNPATLARDIKLLATSGYQVQKWKAVDMFPHSTNVETVVLLAKQ